MKGEGKRWKKAGEGKIKKCAIVNKGRGIKKKLFQNA